MVNAFASKPDQRPYKHRVPDTDLKAKNRGTAPGADVSMRMDFSKEDVADDLLLNEVIWQSVRGAGSRMPAPVRAGFVFPRPKQEGQEDRD
jgi:hypothetical protein